MNKNKGRTKEIKKNKWKNDQTKTNETLNKLMTNRSFNKLKSNRENNKQMNKLNETSKKS